LFSRWLITNSEKARLNKKLSFQPIHHPKENIRSNIISIYSAYNLNKRKEDFHSSKCRRFSTSYLSVM
ncbi:hypothetical protein PO127_26945, partial [Bacteroides thetaiotaomicron]